MERDFKGVWMPKWLWISKDLTPIEKMFFVEIDSLNNSKGCFASNSHFSELFDRAKNSCSEIIKSLEKKGFISIKLERKGKVITKRIIEVKAIRKTEHPYSENRDTPIRKTEHPYSENREGINTNTNNTKERENRALDFLQNNYPSRFETEMMRIKSKIKNWEKFCLDFNDTVDQESLFWSDKVLFARFGKYSRNWIENQDKYSAKEENEGKPVYHRKIS